MSSGTGKAKQVKLFGANMTGKSENLQLFVDRELSIWLHYTNANDDEMINLYEYH